jgi:hypothetical protein
MSDTTVTTVLILILVLLCIASSISAARSKEGFFSGLADVWFNFALFSSFT